MSFGGGFGGFGSNNNNAQSTGFGGFGAANNNTSGKCNLFIWISWTPSRDRSDAPFASATGFSTNRV
jgi:hypothetical protein